MITRVIRKTAPDEGVTLPLETVLDDRLSYAARGVLLDLLSRPEDLDTNADQLSRDSRSARGEARGEGRRAMRLIFAELEAAGYMRRNRRRLPNGEFFTELEVCDVPHGWGSTSNWGAVRSLPRRGRGPVVYLVGERSPRVVKIGVTGNMQRRLAQLQAASPGELCVLWHFGGGVELEEHLHQQFADRRLHGEWFDFRDSDPVKAVSEATDTYFLVPLGTCASW